ncbi:MAG: tRNA pseudouridine(38-40) synthase TruA [Alphaproteobacteria bacterium]
MQRYKLVLEYDGSGFVGWQRQASGPSVQQALEEAVEKFCGERVSICAAGRTDAGVHALGQTVHFDLAGPRPPDTILMAVNQHLRPKPIAVLSVEEVGPDFHARLSAISRAYLYRIINRRSPLTVHRGHAWQVPVPLDAQAMQAGARMLVGRHDFSTFRDSLCQAKSPVKTLDVLEVTRDGDEVRITARARSFLHRQVRSMVGTLKLVGEGKWTADDVAAALAARDRRASGPTAPAEGLYLVEVRF